MNDIFIYYFYLLKHKILVFFNLSKVILELSKRALCHDNSKFRFSETKGMIPLMRQICFIQYGTLEYENYLEDSKETIQLHFLKNDHHPEHFKNYKDMSLLALIEMLVDWKASIKKQPNGSIEKSFEIARERYKMSDEIFHFLKTLI